MSRAVCVRCGASRTDFRHICPSCGYRPADEGLLVAWLLSTEHLTEDKLDAAAERVRSGEEIRPSDAMLRKAKRAMGRSFSSDPGLTASQSLGLLAVSLLFTPLVAWVCWAWWLRDRPRAAWQSFGFALPTSIAFFLLVCFWPF